MEITYVIPSALDSDDLDFELMDCLAEGPEVEIVQDDELSLSNLNSTRPASVIELLGNRSKITFFTDCDRPYLVIRLKPVKRFFSMTIVCLDDLGKERVFEMTNKSSVVVIEHSKVSMPIEIGQEGWQQICLQTEEFLANAFGTSLQSVRQITFAGSCRISKVYFQSKMYADVELPSSLRVVNRT